jgi:hypothetical protein
MASGWPVPGWHDTVLGAVDHSMALDRPLRGCKPRVITSRTLHTFGMFCWYGDDLKSEARLVIRPTPMSRQDALPDTTFDGGVDALGYGVSNEEKRRRLSNHRPKADEA